MTAIMKRINFGEFDGADAVKSWSMVDYLLAQHRDKFIEFLMALKELSDPKENKVVDGRRRRDGAEERSGDGRSTTSTTAGCSTSK
jgi:hypothetical protein